MKIGSEFNMKDEKMDSCLKNDKSQDEILNQRIEAQKKYTVGGWGSINPNVEGPAIYNVLEDYILDKQNISPMQNNPVTIKGM